MQLLRYKSIRLNSHFHKVQIYFSYGLRGFSYTPKIQVNTVEFTLPQGANLFLYGFGGFSYTHKIQVNTVEFTLPQGATLFLYGLRGFSYTPKIQV